MTIDEFCWLVSSGEPPGTLRTVVIFSQALPVDLDATDEEGHTPVVFIPDLHLISLDRATGYGDFFHLNQKRKEILLAFLSRLVELRDHTPELANLKLYQLGDLHDLWREAQHWWGESAPSMMSRQLESHRDLFELLRALNTERLAGNHDRDLRSSKVREELANAPISDLLPLDRLHPDFHSFLWGRECRVDLLHADQVDPAEVPWYRKPLNPIGSRFAQHGGIIDVGDVDEWKHEVSLPSEGDSGLLQPTIQFGDTAASPTQTKFFEAFRDGETCAPDASMEMREAMRAAVIIGHTHAPRIVSGQSATSFSLVDCGSWVNQSQSINNPQDIFWNSQIGVLSGNEAAVLQISP